MTEPRESLLLTDLYELTMVQSYLAEGLSGQAVFEFFVRRLPPNRNFLIAAGIEEALAYLEDAGCSEEDLAWLAAQPGMHADLIAYLRAYRFTGDVDAMPEGTIFFPHEPVLRVTAPLPQAQLAETRLINLLHFCSVVASKAVRVRLAAPGKTLIDFGLRRAHGAEAGMLAARTSYAVGFDGTSNVLAARHFGLPAMGTMAHSYIEAHADEAQAFEAYARSNPGNVVFLLDTYDTEAAARTVVRLAPRLQAAGIAIRGVRIDSGDLAAHARRVRAILDDGGLHGTTILASGNLDEFRIQELLATEAPIDGFGIGAAADNAADAPLLDCGYKLVAYRGRPRRKKSEAKETWAGAKQVFRQFDAAGRIARDVVALTSERLPGTPLLQPMMRNGRRVAPPANLDTVRSFVRRNLDTLPEALRSLQAAPPFTAEISPGVLAATAAAS
jgi:nicotinate phosphoribosyltransferase